MNVHIIRQESGPQGTFGHLFIIEDSAQPQHAPFATGELPWMDNQADVSCIPMGTYRCEWLYSPTFMAHKYHVLNVPGRENVMIHQGNFCGGEAQGLKSDVKGCILLGRSKGILEGQKAVLTSSAAIEEFEALMGGEPFDLTILEAYAA